MVRSITVVFNKAFINKPILSSKLVINNSTNLSIMSTKYSSNPPCWSTSNKIYVKVSFNDKAVTPVPFESAKSATQSKLRHCLFEYCNDFLPFTGNWTKAFNVLLTRFVLK